jgi:hypothetical protein
MEKYANIFHFPQKPSSSFFSSSSAVAATLFYLGYRKMNRLAAAVWRLNVTAVEWAAYFRVIRQEPLKPRTAVKTQTCIGLSWTWAC